MNGEGVNGGCEMLGVDLSKLFASTVIFVIHVHHLVSHLAGSYTMNFKHLQTILCNFTLDQKTELVSQQ